MANVNVVTTGAQLIVHCVEKKVVTEFQTKVEPKKILQNLSPAKTAAAATAAH